MCCSKPVLTWYSTMASLRSSARSHTVIVCPSFSACPPVLERSNRLCSLSLIPSRALRSGYRGSRSDRMKHTHSNKLFRRLNSSAFLGASTSTPIRSNRARTDSIFLLAGDFCERVIQRNWSPTRVLLPDSVSKVHRRTT